MTSLALRRPSPAAVAALAAATVLTLLVALPVIAHADLASATPADGATLDAPPAEITLTFTEGLSASKASFKVVDASGATVLTARPAKDGAASMTADGSALAPGAYTIKWTAAAQDGHTTRGQLRFTVAAPTPAPATPAPDPTDAPSSAPVEPSPSAASATVPAATTGPASAAPAPTSDPAPDASIAGSGDVLLPILGAIIVLGVIGVLVLRRSKAA